MAWSPRGVASGEALGDVALRVLLGELGAVWCSRRVVVLSWDARCPRLARSRRESRP